MQARYRVVLVMLVGTMLSGCGTVPEAPTQASTAGEPAGEEVFVALNQNARDAVECLATFGRVRPDGRLEVAANLRNTSENQLRLKVACIFQDAQGKPLKEEVPRLTIEMAAGAIETVSFTSIGPEAKRYTLRVSATR